MIEAKRVVASAEASDASSNEADFAGKGEAVGVAVSRGKKTRLTGEVELRRRFILSTTRLNGRAISEVDSEI